MTRPQGALRAAYLGVFFAIALLVHMVAILGFRRPPEPDEPPDRLLVTIQQTMSEVKELIDGLQDEAEGLAEAEAAEPAGEPEPEQPEEAAPEPLPDPSPSATPIDPEELERLAEQLSRSLAEELPEPTPDVLEPTPSPELEEPEPLPTPTPTPTPSPEPTPAPTPEELEPLPTPSPEPTPTPIETPKPSPSPSPIETPKPTPSPVPMPSPSPTETPKPAPTPSVTPRPSPSPAPVRTPTPRPSPQATPTPRVAQLPPPPRAETEQEFDRRISQSMTQLSDFERFARSRRKAQDGPIPKVILINDSERELMEIIATYGIQPYAYLPEDTQAGFSLIDLARRQFDPLSQDYAFLSERYTSNAVITLTDELLRKPLFQGLMGAMAKHYQQPVQRWRINLAIPRRLMGYMNWKALTSCQEAGLDPKQVVACQGKLVRTGRDWSLQIHAFQVQDATGQLKWLRRRA